MAHRSGIPTVSQPLVCRKKARPGIYYHYTSLDTLWAVLDTETLRATQACFSNDSEEVEKGKVLIEEICKKIYDQNQAQKQKKFLEYAEKLTLDGEEGVDCYIICFCKADDKLSQWRAYCRNDGVSIGFAFDGTQPNYFFRDMPVGNQPSRNFAIYPVWYLGDSSEAVSSQIDNIVSKEAVTLEILNHVKKIGQLTDFQKVEASLEATIPLIKNAGFYEEEEYRLLICNSLSAQGGASPYPLNPYVMTRQDNGLQSPYINICFGKKYQEKTKKDAAKDKIIDQEWDVKTIRLYNVSKNLSDLIQRRFADIHVVEDNGSDILQKQIVIGPGHDEKQKKVFEKVERTVNEICGDAEKKTIKIWCEGHLPIRSIRVSPSSNQDQVIKSIKHYCKHKKYWLKYVDVVGSSIPYRRPK